MSPSSVIVPLQHMCSETCTNVQLCIALQCSSSLAYLEYCETLSCASTDAVRTKIVEKLGGNSKKNRLKEWFLLRKTTISEIEVSFVGTTLVIFVFLVVLTATSSRRHSSRVRALHISSGIARSNPTIFSPKPSVTQRCWPTLTASFLITSISFASILHLDPRLHRKHSWWGGKEIRQPWRI